VIFVAVGAFCARSTDPPMKSVNGKHVEIESFFTFPSL